MAASTQNGYLAASNGPHMAAYITKLSASPSWCRRSRPGGCVCTFPWALRRSSVAFAAHFSLKSASASLQEFTPWWLWLHASLGVAVLVGGICGVVFGAFQVKDTPAGLVHLHKVRPPPCLVFASSRSRLQPQAAARVCARMCASAHMRQVMLPAIMARRRPRWHAPAEKQTVTAARQPACPSAGRTSGETA